MVCSGCDAVWPCPAAPTSIQLVHTAPTQVPVVACIPAGTTVRTTHPQHRGTRGTYTASRARRVRPHTVYAGRIVLTEEVRGGTTYLPGTVVLPVLEWVGAGGYWCRVQVTPALVEANAGWGLPPLPQPDGAGRLRGHRLVVAPTYDVGYTVVWPRPEGCA